MNILKPKLKIIICFNLRLIYYPATPILNQPHTAKKDKSKVESQIIRVGSKLRDMHQLHMSLWRFLYNENFHYLPEGALEVCHRYRTSSMTSSTYPQHFFTIG